MRSLLKLFFSFIMKSAQFVHQRLFRQIINLMFWTQVDISLFVNKLLFPFIQLCLWIEIRHLRTYFISKIEFTNLLRLTPTNMLLLIYLWLKASLLRDAYRWIDFFLSPRGKGVVRSAEKIHRIIFRERCAIVFARSILLIIIIRLLLICKII